jgi:hypothetical protein
MYAATTIEAFALLMPGVNTGTMQEFLTQFVNALPKNKVAAMFVELNNDDYRADKLIEVSLQSCFPSSRYRKPKRRNVIDR